MYRTRLNCTSMALYVKFKMHCLNQVNLVPKEKEREKKFEIIPY